MPIVAGISAAVFAIVLFGTFLPLGRTLPPLMAGVRREVVVPTGIPPLGMGMRFRPMLVRSLMVGAAAKPTRRRACGLAIRLRVALARPRTLAARRDENLVAADQAGQLCERIVLRLRGMGRAIPRIGIERLGTV